MKVVAFLFALLAVTEAFDFNNEASTSQEEILENRKPLRKRLIDGRGQIWCGNVPAQGAFVQLFSENTNWDGRDNLIGYVRVDMMGNFHIKGRSREPLFNFNRYIIITHTCGADNQLKLTRYPMFPNQHIRVQLDSNAPVSAQPTLVNPFQRA